MNVRSEQETPVHHETRLRARRERTRNRRQQESPNSRESRLQVRRKSARARRQSERGLQRQQRGQQQHDVSRQHGIMMEKFKADLQTSPDYCIVCNCLVFADKVKIVHDCVLNGCPPTVHVMFNYRLYNYCIGCLYNAYAYIHARHVEVIIMHLYTIHANTIHTNTNTNTVDALIFQLKYKIP